MVCLLFLLRIRLCGLLFQGGEFLLLLRFLTLRGVGCPSDINKVPVWGEGGDGTKTKCHPPCRHFSTACFPFPAVAYFNFRFRKNASRICALIMLSSTMRTLIGGILPRTEFFVGTASFSTFGLTRGNPLGGRGESTRSATGEGDRGLVVVVTGTV